MAKKFKPPARFPFPLWFLPVCIAAIAIAYFAQYHWFPDGISMVPSGMTAQIVSEIHPVSGIYISEIMTSNRSAWAGEDSTYSDWVELYNAGKSPVNLEGWTLTDKPTRRTQFHFPDHVLQPGECVLVYCSGKLENTAGAPYHAPFKLSSTGDALLLYDESGAIMESINVPALAGDYAYARLNSNGDWAITQLYTPGFINTQVNHIALTTSAESSQSPVVINELMAENKSILRDKEGAYADWIELYNPGDTPISLEGYHLSDDPDDLFLWRFGDITIQPKAHLIVFASGKNRFSEEELHTNFRLNAEGETVIFTDAQGAIIQTLTYELLKPDQSLVRRPDGSYEQSSAPTPGN